MIRFFSYKRIVLQFNVINKLKYPMEIQKPHKYSFFLDVSGSVGGSPNYWNTVSQIVALYAKQIQTYYLWDSNIQIVDRKYLETFIEKKHGRGGTSPSLVAKQCSQKNIKNIILITDGQVGDSDVKQCDVYLQKHNFAKTICYIISTSNYGELNMSVTCPFTRNCENKVFKKQYDGQLETMVQFTPQDYKILDTLDTITLQNFAAEYDKIEGLIIALNMGKQGNIPLKNNLVIMKNRLVKQLAKQKGSQKKNLSQTVRQYLENNDFNSAIQEMRNICTSYFSDQMTTDLQKKISHLINLCGDLRGQYNLNQIKSNKMATAINATEAQIDKEVEVNDLSKNPIQCPILNQDDVPQILIDECEPLLLGVEKNIVDDIAACPLRILNYPDIREKLKSRLSNYVGVMGIKAKFDTKLLKNPFTQNRLLGSIPLGTHQSHVKVGNYTIAKLISGGKILGNLNMYYAVVWHLIKQGSIQYLKDIQKNATQHLIYRFKNSQTYASLCGQAQFVTTMVSTDIAVWFCVNSGYLNNPTDRDTFRYHYYNLEPMIKIVEVLGYPNDKGLIAHYNRTKSLLNLLSIYKSLKSSHDKKSFKNMLLGLYQNGIFINVKNLSKKFIDTEVCSTFIPIDGPASKQQIQKIRDGFSQKYKFTKPLTNEQLYYLGSVIDPQKQASAYFLDYNIKIPELPEFLVNWKYGLQIHEDDQVEINPKTLRPFYKVKDHTWRQAAKDKFKMQIVDMFNSYKYFQAFVYKYHQVPTVDQLNLFYYNRYVESSKYKSLPFETERWTRQTVDQYKPYFQKMQIKEIIKLFEQSRVIQKRIKIQSQV